MMKPRFLYDSVLKGITPTFSGTTVVGKGPTNSTDWMDFSYFTADAGDLDFVTTTNTDIDAIAIYCATHTASSTIALKYESTVSSFTTLATKTATSGILSLDEFTGVTVTSGRRIRLSFTGGPVNVRQIVVGEVMEAEMGQFDTMIYPNFTQGVKSTNVMSVNGSILGRSIKRMDRRGKLSLEHLTAAWVRSTWEPFANHCVRFPFIYWPNPTGQPTEVAFASVLMVQGPQNMGMGDRMSVEWDLHMLVADNEAV